MNTSSTRLHASAAADEAAGLTDKALGATRELAAQAIDEFERRPAPAVEVIVERGKRQELEPGRGRTRRRGRSRDHKSD